MSKLYQIRKVIKTGVGHNPPGHNPPEQNYPHSDSRRDHKANSNPRQGWGIIFISQSIHRLDIE